MIFRHDMTIVNSKKKTNRRPPHPSRNVNKPKSRLPRNSILSLQITNLLTSPHNLPRLPTLINSNNINLLTPSRPLKPRAHLPENRELIERQLPLKHRLRILPALHQSLLQVLHEGHGFLHLAVLRDLGFQFFVVDRDVDGVEGLADQVDVFLLPRRVLLGGVDGDLLWFLGVEGGGFALGQLLGDSGFRGCYVGGGCADVARCRGELGGWFRDVWEDGVVDARGLFINMSVRVSL